MIASISYIVRDANHFVVADVYFASEPGHTRCLMSRDEARTIAATIAKLPDLEARNGKKATPIPKKAVADAASRRIAPNHQAA
jgi:hypothetical protein